MNILPYLNRTKIIPLRLFPVLLLLLLAASAHKRCTSLVCSCYVAARNSDSKDEENIQTSRTSRFIKPNLNSNKDGFNSEGRSIRGGLNGESSGSKSKFGAISCNDQPMPLKSNLKKGRRTIMEIDELRMDRTRKVNWPDALGNDIAHVQEFEPSEDGELGSVQNSCICVIQ